MDFGIRGGPGTTPPWISRMTLSGLQTEFAKVSRRALIQEQQFKQPCLCYESTCAYTCSRAHTQTPFLCTRAHTHTPFFCTCAYTHSPFFCTHTLFFYAHAHHSFAHTHTHTILLHIHTHTILLHIQTIPLHAHTHTHHSFEQIPYRSHLCNFLLLPFIC